MGSATQGHIVSVVQGPSDYGDSRTVERATQDAINRLPESASLIRPGDRVVLKPNWVKEHDERFPGPDQWDRVITHPSVINGVANWVAERLAGSGAIVIGDAPQTDSSFAKIREYSGLDSMIERLTARWPGVEFSVLDLRQEEWTAVDGVTVAKTPLPGDPNGATRVALNEDSEFVDFSGLGRLYGASYDMAETNLRHQGATHEYLLCRTAMDADVFINLPKLKTHKKVGLTCALKNLVGVNAQKNWLPHHTEGAPEEGGDQFPQSTTKSRLERSWMGAAKRFLKDRPALSRWFVPLKRAGRMYFGDTQSVVRSGNWHGNDTCWRMVVDLNKCVLHYDGDGRRRSTPKRYLAVVDGIIGGQGNGPMAPDPVSSAVIVAGTHPLAVDCVAARLMGFDWRKIRLLREAFQVQRQSFTPFSHQDIRAVLDDGAAVPVDSLPFQRFEPHFGWKGAIELTEVSEKA